MKQPLGFILVLLTACSTNAQFEAALTGARARCDAARTSNISNLATEQCKSQAMRRLWTRYGYTGAGDLREAFLTEREAIAEQEDLGKITPTQAAALKAAATARATSEWERRTAASRPIATPVICNTFGTVTTCN